MSWRALHSSLASLVTDPRQLLRGVSSLLLPWELNRNCSPVPSSSVPELAVEAALSVVVHGKGVSFTSTTTQCNSLAWLGGGEKFPRGAAVSPLRQCLFTLRSNPSVQKPQGSIVNRLI